MSEPSDCLEILRQLVAIPSVNPAMSDDPELRGEARLVDWLEPWFAAKGFRTRRLEMTAGRPNLLAEWGAARPRKTILFESHLDTVGVSGFQGHPFALRQDQGRLYGRGACDTKGPMAAFMGALSADVLAALDASGVRLIWLGAIGEETGNLGAEEAIADGLRADACVVLEPTDLRIIHAHKGVVWFTAATRGRAVHASAPEYGDNAILKMPAVWQIMVEATEAAAEQFRDSPLGRPTFSVGTIHGGTGANIVPDRCTIQVDRRLMPGETAAAVIADLRARFQAIPGGVEIDVEKEGLPFYTPPNAALVRQFASALEHEGVPPGIEGAPWCSDAGPLAAICSEIIVWGPGAIAQAHTTDEYILRASLETGYAVMKQFLKNHA